MRVRLLGEDLVAFRDSLGRVGLIEELCPQPPRLALAPAQRGERPSRVYQGWKLDTAGNCVDQNQQGRRG